MERILAQARASVAFGALACGADIVIAETVLALKGELHIVLPFPEDDFIAVSVASGVEAVASAQPSRIVTCHLGAGASLCAIA